MGFLSKDNLKRRFHEEETFHDRMVEDHDTRGGYFYKWGLSAEAIDFARKSLGITRGKRVLDYGCGTGGETIWLAKNGAYVTAIDISQRMVEITLKNAEMAGMGNRVIAKKMFR